jgi:hypothetical protein
MRKTILIATVAALAMAGCSSNKQTPAAPAETHQESSPPASSTPVSAELARLMADSRTATAKYVSDVALAQKDGYQIITPMMPGMGYHYLNPAVKGFDVTKPPILVYLKSGTASQLAAIEWVFPEKPASPPLEGATYGSFAAACHFKDGTFVPAAAEKDCAKTSASGSPFNFWHPDLTTLHVWLWYHNPDGLYHGTNPLVQGST